MANKDNDQEMSDLAMLLAAGCEVKLAPWAVDLGGGIRADVTGCGTSSHGYGATVGEALRAVPIWPLGDEGQADDEDALEPYCTTCGRVVGVFIGHGDGWHHYLGNGTVEDPTELYDPVPGAGRRLARSGRTMTAVLAAAAAVAAVVVLGVYLRWAVRPVAVAFRLGRAIGRRP